MNEPKLTIKDALNAVKAFARQSEKNAAFGVLADTENGNLSAFIKGKEVEILTMITFQMAKDKTFKELLFRAVELYKFAPLQEILNNYEQNRQYN